MNSLVNKKIISFSFVVIAAIIIISSCRKRDDVVPNVYVDIYLYANSPEFVNLNAPGGWVYITGGVKGILVYRKSTTDFKAYDRNCTYQPSESCARVEVDSSNIIVKCPCCGSQFEMVEGTVTKGPAGQSLKSYETSFDGSVLHIYNY